MAVASLQPIYERLNGADGYHPFSANTFADWSIEAGDIVNLKRGADSYASPVHTSHLSWRGSPQIVMQSTGTKELESIGKATQKKFNRSGGGYRAAQTVGKKSSVYFQKPDPQLSSELNINDVWIESDMLNSWGEVGEMTWEELAEYTWMDFYGSKMYAWDGTNWVEIADEQKANYNFDILRNTIEELISVKGDLSGVHSEIKQTKSEFSVSLENTQEGLSSQISQTAGQILLRVADTKNELQSSINVQAGQISLVVEGTGANAHIKPASIVAAINAQTGQSSVLIDADKVKISGNVSLSDAMDVDGNGYILMKKYVFFNQQALFNSSISLFDGSVAYSMTGTTLATTIKEASVSGNTLTLTQYDGTPVTFSKATTLDVSSWSGSVLTVTAKQNNVSVATKQIGFGGSYGDHDIDLVVEQNGSIARSSSTTAIIPVKVAQLQGGGASTNRYTPNLLVDMSSLLTTGSYNTSGTKTPGSSYIGFSSVTFTIPNASGFTKNDANYNTANSNQVGSISKSGLTANTYMYWTVGGKKYHIVVNA